MKKLIGILFVLLLLYGAVFMKSVGFRDYDGDSQKELLILIKRPWEPYCNRVVIYDGLKRVSKSLQELGVWKMQCGDVNQDGRVDIGFGVYKKSPYHQVMAKRPFFYTYRGKEILPLFRASRTAETMQDFWIVHFYEGDFVVTKEGAETTKFRIYEWKSFGFVELHYIDRTDLTPHKWNELSLEEVVK